MQTKSLKPKKSSPQPKGLSFLRWDWNHDLIHIIFALSHTLPCSVGSHQTSFFFLHHYRAFTVRGLYNCFLSSHSLLPALCKVLSFLSFRSQFKTYFPEWLSLLILVNEWLLTSHGKTSQVRKGPDGAASTPLDWMVRTCALFLLIESPTALSCASHRLVLAYKILHPIPMWCVVFLYYQAVLWHHLGILQFNSILTLFMEIALDPTG